MNIKEKRKIKNLTYHLVKNGKITTTVPAAKLVKSKVEKLITYAKVDNAVNRKYVASRIPKEGMNRLFKVIGPANVEKKGGYTRLVRIENPRKGDGSQMCLLEIINV